MSAVENLTKRIALTVNGKKVEAEVESRMTLAEFLREGLGLTGTKVGCNRAECGSCTVILDGNPAYSCTVLAAEVGGKEVLTIEGLTKEDGTLHPLQEAFVDADALQCGYCTPGMILSSVAFLEKNPAPTLEEIAMGLKGNICRCTGYTKIVKAVHAASREMGGRGREG